MSLLRTWPLRTALAAGLERCVDWSVRHVFVVVCVFALILSLAVYALQGLSMTTNTTDMFSEDLEFRQIHAAYQQAFPHHVDTMLLVIDAPAPESAFASADTVEAALRSRPDLFQDVYRPEGGEFMQRHSLLFRSVADLERLSDRLAQLQPFLGVLATDRSLRGILDLVRQALTAEPVPLNLSPVLQRLDGAIDAALDERVMLLSWMALLDDDRRESHSYRTVVVARPVLDFSRLQPAAEAMAFARGLEQQLASPQANGGDVSPRVRITGSVALAHEELASLIEGGLLIASLMLGFLMLVLYLALRSLRLVLATGLTLLAGLLITAGFAAMAVGELNLISVAFAVLYVGLGVDFAIHLCLAQQESMYRGASIPDALRRSAREIGPAIALCGLTTAVAFFSFIPTDYAGVAELGLIAGVGMLVGFVVSLTLQPALLVLVGAPLRWRQSSQWPLFATLQQIPGRNPRIILATAGLVAILSGVLVPFAHFDPDPMNLRNPDSESVATYRLLLADSERSPLSLSALTRDAATAERVALALQSQPEVERVRRLASFIPGNQAIKLQLLEDMHFIIGPIVSAQPEAPPPDVAAQRDAIEQLLPVLAASDVDGAAELGETLYRLHRRLDDSRAATVLLQHVETNLLSHLPYAFAWLETALQAGAVQRDALPPDLVSRWRAPDGIHRLEIYPHGEHLELTEVRGFVESVRAIVPTVTGSPVLMLEAGDAVLAAFQQAFVTALAAIAVILLLALRSLRHTALVLLPLLLGGLVTAGATVLLGLSFNFASIIALPLLLGVSIDYGIHTVSRARRLGGAPADLLGSSTAKAIFYSALTTVLSFGNLALSTHVGTASMGILLTMGIVLTLLVTLVVLPATLRLIEREPAA